MKKKPTVIQGYTIIERKQAGEVMVAVGHHPTAPSPYVTWKAYEHSGFSNFGGGNYFATLQDAMVDYYRRLAEAWEYYTPAKNPKKDKGKKPRQSDPPTS